MKYLLLLILSTISFQLFAQPLNDDCSGTLEVNIGDCGIYNNVAAQADIDIVNFTPIGLSCLQTEREVWFSFTTSDIVTSLQISVTGIEDNGTPAMQQPRITFIRGLACVVFEASACNDAPLGSNVSEMIIDESFLFTNEQYFFFSE